MFKVLIEKLIGSNEVILFEQKIYHIVLIMGTIISGLAAAVNAVMSLNISATVLWFVASIVWGFLYYISRFKNLYEPYNLVTYSILIFVCYPVGWFFDHGSLGTMPLYITLFITLVMLTLSNKWRSIFVTYILLSTIILNIIEYYRPSIFPIYANSQTRLIDFTVQIIIVVISMIIILKLYMNELYKERNCVNSLNCQLVEKNEILNKLSIMDELTSAYNRRYIFQALTDKINNHHFSDDPFYVLMFDVDYYKRINDTYGHDVGDYVLKSIVAELKTLLSSDDIIGRYGGDEFIIILGSMEQGIAKYIDELQDIINRIDFDERLSISGGLIKYRGEKMVELLKGVDILLYKAKLNGRACIVKDI